MDNHIDIIPLIKIRSSDDSIKLISNFFKNIDISLLEYIKIINKEKEEERSLEKTSLLEEKDVVDKKLKSLDSIVKKNFIIFIARAGLFLTEICSKDGLVLEKHNDLHRLSFLRRQINILLCLAEWKENTDWNEVNSLNLDEELLSFFQDNIEPMAERYGCDSAPLHIVNNAAPLAKNLKNKCFCPYTSILDGMPQCSWGSSQGHMEYGNMDFKICNNSEDIFYEGKLTFPGDGNIDKINLSFFIQPSSLIKIHGNKNIYIYDDDLTAHVVLGNTLNNMMMYILSLSDDIKTSILNSDDVFTELFNIFTDDPSLFNIVFSEILFKGIGDFFQEINCVCKNGGYIKGKYDRTSSHIAPYFIDDGVSSGDQLRFFVANDRPSGTRFIFMLKYGNPTEINLKAFGGYYSSENKLIIKRDGNANKCLPIIGGRKTKKLKKKKVKKTKKYIKKNNISLFLHKFK